mgnify:CR=1 FL=1
MNQLKIGAVLSYISIFLTNIIALLYTPYLLRMLGQSEYGLYSLVASVIAYLTVLDLGFGNAIVRYTAKYRVENRQEEQYEMFGIGVFALLIGLGLYFNVDTLFSSSMDYDEIRKIQIMMLLMTLNLAITFPFSLFGSIITAYEDFIFQKLINILNPLVMVVMLNMGYKAIGMVVVTTLFNIVTLLINYWYCCHKIKIKIYFRRFRWDFFKEISIYSFWIFLSAIGVLDNLF